MNSLALFPARTEAGECVTQPWYVVQLKPNAEAIAKRNLQRQGVQIFAPFEELQVRRARKLVQTRRALFPGYLFVSFDPYAVSQRTVNSTMGISRLVSFAEDRPARVPRELISSLMRRCDPSGKLLPSCHLQGGDKVHVTKGPLAEFVGTVEQLASDQRAWILLEILGKQTRVAIKSADLRLKG